jgi:hypothetical protein
MELGTARKSDPFKDYFQNAIAGNKRVSAAYWLELRKSSASITGCRKGSTKAYERCLKTVDAARMFLDISEAEELRAFMEKYVQRQIRLYEPTVIMETVEDLWISTATWTEGLEEDY